jgi:hypothetical protein
MRVARRDIALRLYDSEVIQQPRIFRKRGVTLILQRTALPIRVDLSKYVFVFFRNSETVSVSLFKFVKLIYDPVHSVFREYGGRAVRARVIAHYKPLRVDIYGHIAQHGVEHICPLQYDLVLLMFTVGFCCIHRTFRADGRLRV